MERHRHCINCGVSIPANEYFCSKKCELEFAGRRKKALLLQVTIFAGVFFIIFMIYFLGR
jgi:predicted nucleic acid-binding Zn ribbon protein